MARRVVVGVVLAGLACAAAGARAESEASLMRRAPGLGMAGKVTPLAGAVAIGGAGWGPFRELCVANVLVNPKGQEVPANEPSCLTVEEAAAEGGAWRLVLRLRKGEAPVARFRAVRDAAGVVSGIELLGDAPVLMADRIRAGLAGLLSAHGMPRGEVAPGRVFVLPVPALDPDLTVAGGGFQCRAEGMGAVGGRPALVAACVAHGRGETEGRRLSLDLAGRFAIDVATGLVRRYGYASDTVLAGDGKGNGEIRLRGASRQRLD